MGVDAGDYDHDGNFDLFVTNFTDQSDNLYRNLGPKGFTDMAWASGLGQGSYPLVKWGTGFVDVDNDGWLDVLVANGLPRPTPADDDRIGGWQWMYQLLETDSWVITDNCAKLIDCLPQLVRDDRRIEDIRKVDGDDPADAARYGLVAAARFGAGLNVVPGFSPAFGGAQSKAAGLKPGTTAARFVTGMPLGEQIARQVTAEDATSRAIHFQRLESEAQKQFRTKKLPRRW